MMRLKKVTTAGAGSRRSYHDACGTAHALDLVGERWALLVMRELLLGPKRFSDLRADLPGISANVLTQRLEGLEATGIVVRRKLPPPASVQVYELTPWGSEIEPIIKALGRWAARSAEHDPSLPISASSVVLSLRTMFSPERAKSFRARFGIIMGEESFEGEVADGAFRIERGAIGEAEAVISAPPAVVAAVVYGDASIDTLAASGELTVSGDRRVIERFITLFPLPPKAGAHRR